jgi:hypothetical protein
VSQLTFQPALDPFHAIFRIFRLLQAVNQPAPLDLTRILDFYLLFPFRIRSLRLAPKHQKYKKLSEKYAHLTPYGEQPEPVLLLKRMQPMQLAALETLASKSYINPSAWASELVQKTERTPPSEIESRAEEQNKQQSDLIEFLQLLAAEYDISGDNGLKARSGLLEYRYDTL